MLEFTFDVPYFHRVSDIYCMRLYVVYQTLNIIFSVIRVLHLQRQDFCKDNSSFLLGHPYVINNT